jgi:hypothetical protein
MTQTLYANMDKIKIKKKLTPFLFFKSLSLDSHCPMFSLISLKVLALRLALSHVLS